LISFKTFFTDFLNFITEGGEAFIEAWRFVALYYGVGTPTLQLPPFDTRRWGGGVPTAAK
jgi:hypothetical protein